MTNRSGEHIFMLPMAKSDRNNSNNMSYDSLLTARVKRDKI